MAKKGTRPAKTNGQRAREEQWRRRAAQVSAGGSTSVVDGAPADDGSEEAAFAEAELPETTIIVPTSSAARSMPSMPRTPQTATRMSATGATASARPTATQPRPQGAAASMAARRAGTAAAVGRSAKSRLAPNTLSIDDEMYFVRSDIRRLILLTVICVVLLIVLFLVIPK